jgi:hypothetical protein
MTIIIKREGINMDLSVKEIERAAERIAPSVHRTKLERSKTFSEMSGAEVYFKFENQQKNKNSTLLCFRRYSYDRYVFGVRLDY